MRDWKGQAVMRWLNQSVHTQSWFETYRSGVIIFTTLNSKDRVGDGCGDEFQSQLSLTISYTNGERLEGLRCCELPKSVSTPSIWVQKVHTVQARTVPTHDQKIGSDELCRAQPPI